MSSTFITEGDSETSSANDTVIIIVNNESGSISMDEETLQKLLASGSENTTVSVVQLAEDNLSGNAEETGADDAGNPQVNLTLEGFYTPGLDPETHTEALEPQQSSVDTIDPFLNIDQEEIEKIAHALQSDQAGHILGGSLTDMLDNDSQSEVLCLLDRSCEDAPDPHAEIVSAINMEHSYSIVPPQRAQTIYSMNPTTSLSDRSDTDDGRTPSPASSSRNSLRDNSSLRAPSPKRRSQRQIEKIEKEQLEKIRAENEEMLKKEKEEMKKQQEEQLVGDQLKEVPQIPEDTKPPSDRVPTPPAKMSPVADEPKKPPPTRMAEIRQAMQEQILAMDPLGKKATTVSKSLPSPIKAQGQNGQENPTVASPVVPTPSPTTPLSSEAGRKSYPKRENRKPPPHLRDVLLGPSLFSTPDVMRVVGNNVAPPEKKPKAETMKKSASLDEHDALAELAASFEATENVPEPETSIKVVKSMKPVKPEPGQVKVQEEDDDEESGSEQSWNSEDDPDRLWCICRKPHNNRFMICCDKCEEWFHGKCVGLTRQMGKEMEARGIEWVCPKCKAQSAARKVERKNSHVSIPENKPELEEESSTMKCIISGCANEARPNSIYCSDQCIMQHAKESLALYSKDSTEKEQNAVKDETKEVHTEMETKKSGSEAIKPQNFYRKSSPTPPTKASPASSLHVTRKIIVLQELPNVKGKGIGGGSLEEMAVMVYERKSGKILQGNLAPKLSNLETWLKEHPTFEVLKPGMIPKTKERVEKPTPIKKRKDPPKPVVTVEKKEKKATGPEVMRSSVRTSLKDALHGRAKEAADITLNEQDISDLAVKIEEELYSYFGDLNLKYKSKYRSLTFNIRDVKNEGLFRKILKGEMKPKQLVRMSPEDLASQELAQWRERETKHQLEIIQKTELESLSLANKYILKTHKGEEVIENYDALKSLESAQKELPGLSMLEDATSQHKSHLFDLNCQICAGKVKEADYFPKPEKESKDAKDKDRHSKSKEKHRSSSSSSSKKDDRHHGEGKHRRSSSSSSKDLKDSKEKDRERKHKDRHKDKGREKRLERSSSTTSSASDKSKSLQDKTTKEEQEKEKPKHLEIKESDSSKKKDLDKKGVKFAEKEGDDEATIETDQETASKPIITTHEEPTSTVVISTPEQSPVVLSPKLGPTSAVWKGNIVSSESGKFHVLGFEVSGLLDKLPSELPESLDVIGRIKPTMAWDYVRQTKRVGTRDVVVLRFLPTTDMDKKNFNAFNYYLTKCDRLGVIGNLPKSVKDFYIFPLAPSDPIPAALLPFEGPGLEVERPVMLLGVIIRSKRKRPLERTSRFKSKEERAEVIRAAKLSKLADEPYDPSSPTIHISPIYKPSKRKLDAVDRPNSKVPKEEVDEEPYSPGQPLDESKEPATDNNPEAGSSNVLSNQASMLEELTRKIEENKRQIRSMSSALMPDTSTVFAGSSISPGTSSLRSQAVNLIPGLGQDTGPVIPGLGGITEEPYSPSNQRYTPSPPPPPRTSGMNSSLPNIASHISIPSNLQEILSTIQKKELEQKRINLKSDPIVMTYGSAVDFEEQEQKEEAIKKRVENLAAKDVDMRVLPRSAMAPSVHPPLLGSPRPQLQAPIMSMRTDIAPHSASQLPPVLPLPQQQQHADPRYWPVAAGSSSPADSKGLRALSDAELLAKALEMEKALTTPAPAQKKKKGKGGKDKQQQQRLETRGKESYNSRPSDYSPARRDKERDNQRGGRGRSSRWDRDWDRSRESRDNNERTADWTDPRTEVQKNLSPQQFPSQRMMSPRIQVAVAPPVQVTVPPPVFLTEVPRSATFSQPISGFPLPTNTPTVQNPTGMQDLPKPVATGRFVPTKALEPKEESDEEEPPPPGE